MRHAIYTYIVKEAFFKNFKIDVFSNFSMFFRIYEEGFSEKQ